MIIKWTKKDRAGREVAGVKVIPKMKKGINLGQVILVPGYNEISNENWELIKDLLEENIKLGQISPVTKQKAVVAKAIVKANTEEGLPYNILMDAIKELEMLSKLAELKKEDTGKKQISKEWLFKYLQDNPEEAACVYARANEITKLRAAERGKEAQPVSLKELPANEAIDVIVETFRLDTLEEWKKVESRDEVRSAIANQIEAVNRPPEKGGKK